MIDKQTVDVYNRKAEQWTADSRPQDPEHVSWVDDQRRRGPVVDIGCGPGWSLPLITEPAVALDASTAMLDLTAGNAPHTPRVLASAAALPFAPGSLGGAVANRVYLHLPLADVPLALADLHRALAADAPAFIRVMADGSGTDFRSRRKFAGRLFSGWSDQGFHDACEGAGLAIEWFDSDRTMEGPGRIAVRVRRSHTLADTVGPGMRLLLCGLNPSPYSAEVGIGFARPGNRFWPAALATGAVTRDRDPRHALLVDGIGMTDLVKRPTRQASELTADEYRHGLIRVERLVRWLRPRAVCFVGLAGWRASVDRRAKAGPQTAGFGDVPVYVMPSTSGLNAGSRLEDLIDHLAQALELADRP